MTGNWPAEPACSAGGSSNAPNCIYLPGTTVNGGTPHIDFGYMYDQPGGAQVDLGRLAQLTLIMKGLSSQFVLSGSTGALHPWLYGLLISNAIHMTPDGNFVLTTGASTPTFSGPWNPIRLGEWFRGDRLLNVDGGGDALVDDYVNGLKVNSYKWAVNGSGVNRAGQPVGSGGQSLWLGHSNHQGMTAYVAQCATWEKACPYGPTPNNFGAGNFVPSRIIDLSPLGTPASVYHSYQGDVDVFPDLSATWNNGAAGLQRAHSGFKSNGLPDVSGITGFPNGYPVPASVYDADCPVGKSGDILIPTLVGGGFYQPALPAIPGGSGLRCFDDFIRPADGSFSSVGQQDGLRQALTGPDLGTDDPRSPIGAATWLQGPIQTNPANTPQSWGGRGAAIQYGEGHGALRCYTVQPQRIYRDVGTADHCAVSRRVWIGTYPNQGVTSVLARAQDKDNFLTLFTYARSWQFFYRRYAAGAVAQETLCVPTETNWEYLALWCKGTVVKVMVDSAAGVAVPGLPGLWEIVNTFADNTTTTAQNAGLLGNAGGAGVYADALWASKGFRCYTAT